MASARAGGDKFKWEEMKPMPTKRVFATAAHLDSQIYVTGGCDQTGTPLDAFESLNTNNKKWKRLANMPTKRAAPCVMTVDKKVVAIGGVATNQEPLDVVEIYDTETKQWTSGETMIEKLMGLSAVVKDGRIIVVGGMGLDTNPKDYLMSYNVETNLWQSLPPMPTPRYATFSFLINDKLYVLGGRQGKLPIAACEVYDFNEKKWRKLPDIPSKRVFALYTASEKHIYSLGGLSQNPKDGFTNTTEVFDLEKEEWKVGKCMTTKRGDFAVGFVGGRVVAAGGLGDLGKPLNLAESYDVITDTWTAGPDIPSAHCSCAFLTYKDRLHVIGGLSMNGPSGAVEAISGQ